MIEHVYYGEKGEYSTETKGITRTRERLSVRSPVAVVVVVVLVVVLVVLIAVVVVTSVPSLLLRMQRRTKRDKNNSKSQAIQQIWVTFRRLTNSKTLKVITPVMHV